MPFMTSVTIRSWPACRLKQRSEVRRSAFSDRVFSGIRCLRSVRRQAVNSSDKNAGRRLSTTICPKHGAGEQSCRVACVMATAPLATAWIAHGGGLGRLGRCPNSPAIDALANGRGRCAVGSAFTCGIGDIVTVKNAGSRSVAGISIVAGAALDWRILPLPVRRSVIVPSSALIAS